MNRLAKFKLTLVILGIFCIQTLSSCESVDDPGEIIGDDSLSTATLTPHVESDSIDVNYDGILDFQFLMQQNQTTDIPSSGGSIMLQLHPLDQNAIGCIEPDCNHNEVLEGTLINSETFNWYEYGITITYINRSGSIWDYSWSSECCEAGSGYLAIRLEMSELFHYGWIQLGVDASSGDVLVLDYKVNDLAESSIFAGN